MALYRPAVTDDDSFLSKIIKYIPAEIITVYTAIIGIWKKNGGVPTDTDVKTYAVIVLVIILVTPVWTYFATIDNPNVKIPPSKIKRAIFHALIATISFMIWVYALGDQMFIAWLATTSLPHYSSILGSVVLILYTGLFVPLIERIVLGPPAPSLVRS